MSDLRDELLGAGINKKRIIGVALVAMLLIAIFAFSTVFFSFLFGTQRPNPSKEKAETDPEDDIVLIDIPYPFDEDFWQDLLSQVEDPASLLDMLSEMFDGDIDDLDLGNFSQGLLDLLYSGAGEIEIFRVYNYLSFNNMTDVLWKYECFDEYTGDGWTSNAVSNLYDFYTYGDWLANYFPDPELLELKMPLSPDAGVNSMVIPTLFPSPFVLDTVSAPNLNPSSTQLYKDEYNSTTLDLSFSSTDDVNMTFEIFGFYNHLPSNQELNTTARVVTNPSPEYLSLQNKYLQLPPTIGVYKTNNPYFSNHYDILNERINANDNAFWIANKIRNYLQSQFSFPMSPGDYNPAPEERDVVDWFCETEQGMWSDFATAFCAFARAFGVICRFVDGFNSFMIEEIWDNDEGQWGFAIKYKNLYNWAEIYVPTDIYGNGKWAQFDIFDSFGGGGSPIIGGTYNITVSTDQTAYTRPDTATITANVSSNTDPIDNLTITFKDYTTGRILGQDITDMSGSASIQTSFNVTDIVGPHLIEARYDFFNTGYNLTTILGDIGISLTDISPGEINVSDSQPDITNVAGFVYDPLNGNGLEGPELNIRLFRKGTNIEEVNAFSPSTINTTYDGDFNDMLDLNHNTAGNYEVRADLNGTWWIDTPFGTYSYSLLSLIFQVPYYYLTNSSNRLDFNITKTLDVWFYIDGLPSSYPNIPPNYLMISRYQTLNLTAKAVSVVHGPIPNKIVNFYDYSRGNILIGSDITNSKGIASINYSIDDNISSGPNLLYAAIGLQENYSYYILNEKPTINIISGPIPRVINRTGAGATEFNIVGEIYDSTNNSLPISYSEITLKLLKGGTDYSSYLVPSESYPYQTDSTGAFDLTFGVLSTTPPGNYTLRLDFNGTINLFSFPYPYQFNLPILNTSAFYANELKIDAEASLLFWINGTTYDNYNNPRINRNDNLELTAYIHLAGIPIDDGELVEFYDLTEDNQLIGSATTSAGNATIIYNTNENTVAGPHLIYATWNNKFNYSYFILDAPITVDLDIWPQNREISKFGSFDRTFFIQGYLNDTRNAKPIKYGQISIHIFDGTEILNGLVLESGSYVSNQFGAIFAEFSVNDFVDVGNYTLEVWFNGTFRYSFPNNIFNQHNYYLTYFSNLSIADYQLKVYDPNSINIHFWINGTPTLPTYYEWDGDYPEQFNRGDTINFTVYIAQSGIEVNTGEVRIYDIYNNSYILDNYIYDGSELPPGFHTFLIDTNQWYSGLHYIKINWSSYPTFNTTYIIINEAIDILTSIDKDIILRNVDGFSVSGTVQDNSFLLRGLRLNIILQDNLGNDISLSYLLGSKTITINNDGSYQFFNSIDLYCPQGEYFLNISFTGGLDAPGIFQSDYMVHSNSLLIPINITAGTYIIGNYDTQYEKSGFYENDNLYVYGTVFWDNGTIITNRIVNVTIKDQFGNILATDTDYTDGSGFFNITFTIGLWDEDTTDVFANFYPEDSFTFPENIFIISTEQQIFREP